jgi:hypothetical protein
MIRISGALVTAAAMSVAASALVMRWADRREDANSGPEGYRLPAFIGYLVTALGLLFFWGAQFQALQQGSIPVLREMLMGPLILALPLTIASYCFDFRIAFEREHLLIRRWWRGREIPFRDIVDTALLGFRSRYGATLSLYLRDKKRLRFDGPFQDLLRLNGMIRQRMAGPPRGQWACEQKRRDMNRMAAIVAGGLVLVLLMLITFKVLAWLQP